jgi:hypothetical protein
MIIPSNPARFTWLGVQLGLFLVFLVLAQAIPVSGSARFAGAMVLAVIVKWIIFTVWVNHRKA